MAPPLQHRQAALIAGIGQTVPVPQIGSGVTQGGLMKPETKMDIAIRHLAEAEAAVLRQKHLIQELERDGHPSEGSHILLGLLEERARQARKAIATLRFVYGLGGSAAPISN